MNILSRKLIDNIAQPLMILAGIIFLASLFLGTLKSGEEGALPGFVCLFFGPIYHLGWYANPLLFLSWLLLLVKRSSVFAIMSSVISLLLALTTFYIEEFPANEAGSMTRVTGYGPGFYLWLASIVLTLIAAFLSAIKQSDEDEDLITISS